MPTQTPTDADILLSAMRSALAQVNTAEPGTIVSYDATTQTATVALSIKGFSRDAEGTITAYSRPPIPNVPVVWPRSASGYGWTFPLALGDPVLVIFASRSTDEWRTVTGTEHEPRDPARRHALQDAIAIPGCGSPANALPVTAWASTAGVLAAPEIRLGSSAATSYIALAAAVATNLLALAGAITGAANFAAAQVAIAALIAAGWPVSMASTRVKSL